MDQDLYDETITEGDCRTIAPKRKRRKYRKYPTPQCSPEDRAELLRLQGGKCAIALCDATTDLHLDHSYRDGKTRGYLCRVHNTALGMFKDSEKMLRAAIRYLRNPPAKRLREAQPVARVPMALAA
jgi:Recombination endonuclease VII